MAPDRDPRDAPLLDLAGARHEATVPAEERHARGQYFTPFPVIDLVLDLLDPATPTCVLDPACGSGRFLLGARRRWPGAALTGWDTDPAALALARENLGERPHLTERSFLDAPGEAAFDLIVGNPPYVRRRGARRDVYVDFVEHAARHLRPGGRLAFVLSSAWLDVQYGREVRAALCADFAVEWIAESSVERWFPGAKVNTMVLIARLEPDAARRRAQEARFAEVTQALPSAPVVVRRVPQGSLPLDRPWGPLLRAPEPWLQRWGGPSTLGTLATVSRGFTTNDNALHYPPSDAEIEADWLAPLVKSPRQVPGVRGQATSLTTRVLLAPHAEGREAPPAGVRAWLASAERPDAAPLHAARPQRLLLVKGYGDRFRQPLFDAPVHYDQQLYAVEPRGGLSHELLAGLLNSRWTQLSLELLGRVNFGDGVLWLGLGEARTLPMPALASLSSDRRSAIEQAFAALPTGASPRAPEADADPAWGPALRRLDALVGAALGLDDREIEQVRAAAVTLCRRRLRKAHSLRIIPG